MSAGELCWPKVPRWVDRKSGRGNDGYRDVDAGVFVLKRRLDRAKENVQLAAASSQWLRTKLEEVHAAMFEKARAMRDQLTTPASSYDEMKKILAEKGGFVRCFFKPDRAAEARIKQETKATVRCILLDQTKRTGKSVLNGEESDTEVLFAQAY